MEKTLIIDTDPSQESAPSVTEISDDLFPSIVIGQSLKLRGEVDVVGAKNAVLVIMASLILTEGKSTLTNIPNSEDVLQMIALLRDLGADVQFYPQQNTACVDTSTISKHRVKADIMKKMRASVLVMGPLLARFSRADIALPGGCGIGKRPIDYHIKNFEKMGVRYKSNGDMLLATVKQLQAQRLILEYPSVGATENLMMAAVLTPGVTKIVNAALEPEVLDLIAVLKKMGACIEIKAPACIEIEGVAALRPIDHEIVVDRLEAGSLLLAAAITGGEVTIPNVSFNLLDVFLFKLQEMGHEIAEVTPGRGISIRAVENPRAVSFKTSPYPGFPTDLQAPMMVAQCLAEGTSSIHETVFENRFLHVPELQKMGALISVNGDRAEVHGVDELYGTHVIAGDIRGSCALVLAGLVAVGKTIVTGVHHWKRGYQQLDKKLEQLGARIILKTAR
ncbi:UDP-N-acetylglucosamine 1-carboxyvinyltransferase [Candidatus Babeliales bacterium]|nr:UDP-N-acetylglucosamine 1-carboxyvinyltransferase [Candidatus Babeliales bacterium]